MVQNVELIAD
jgi:hypothetical protein